MSDSYKLKMMKGITEKGIYNKSNWIQEANRHLYSSEFLHQHFLELKDKLKSLYKEDKENGFRRNATEIYSLIHKVEATSKSKLLLLCYSVELFIKAALVCLHSNNVKCDFERLLMIKYGHKFESNLDLLRFKLSKEERAIVKRMEKIVRDEGRYPITPIGDKEYYDQANELNKEMWLAESYDSWFLLVNKIGDFAKSVDSDSNNPARIMPYKMDGDGYFCFRIGGNLPPCITVRFSSEQVELGINNQKELYCIIRSQLQDEIIFHLLNKYESEIIYIEIKNKKIK